MLNVFSITPDDRPPALMYEGSGLTYQRLIGPGRPEEGHLHLIPQAKYSPAPPPDGEGLVVVRGPLTGRSRSGLSLYGHMSSWTCEDGLRAVPVCGAESDGDGDSGLEGRLIQKVGEGWLLAIRNPRVVRWERPNGRAVEAHCADERWFPSDAIAVWADAIAGVALCGELLDCPRDLFGEAIEDEPLWLPTRNERRRLLEDLRPDAYEVVASAARELGLYDAPEALTPPWATPASELLPEVYHLGRRLTNPGGGGRAALYRVCHRHTGGGVLPDGATFPALDDLGDREALSRLALLLRGEASWTDREEWDAASQEVSG